jgi:hypothetical protein
MMLCRACHTRLNYLLRRAANKLAKTPIVMQSAIANFLSFMYDRIQAIAKDDIVQRIAGNISFPPVMLIAYYRTATLAGCL